MKKIPSLLPVTVLSGFLGSGKTTLLNHLLSSPGVGRAAVLVNDMSSINIDATLVVRTREELVELSNGCICCTLRQDLLQEVARLARTGRFDRLIIESTGISEPLPVAQTFTFEEAGDDLRTLTRLDALVTVVDTPEFFRIWQTRDTLAVRNMGTSAEDRRHLSDLLVQQVEFADIVLLNKTDLCPQETLSRVKATVFALNPKARVLETSFSRVSPDQILDTGLFDYQTNQGLPAWERELNAVHIPETEEYGISHFNFVARRPFHPQRLYDFFKPDRPGLLRAKGPLWLATQEDCCWILHVAGRQKRMEFSGFWWAAVKPEHRPEGQEGEALKALWRDPWGDRRQEIVLIGLEQDWSWWKNALEACLVNDREYAQGPALWSRWKDPYAGMRQKVYNQYQSQGLSPRKVLLSSGSS